MSEVHARLVPGFRNQFCINVAIKIKDVTNILVTWRLEALHQGDLQCCQFQKSKKIIKLFLGYTKMYGNLLFIAI